MVTFSMIFDSPSYWLIISLVLIGLELIIPGAYLFWLGIGTAVAAGAVWVFPSISPAVQLIILAVFIIVSVYVGVKVQRKRKNDPADKLNSGLGVYINRQVVVDQDFVNGVGRISVDDTTYNALGTQNHKQGSMVSIVGIQNGRFVVQAVKQIKNEM